jgi:hypothetical protein
VHTVAFVAAGRHFCTGFDLSGLEDLSEGELLLRFVRVETLLDTVWRAPVRTSSSATGETTGSSTAMPLPRISEEWSSSKSFGITWAKQACLIQTLTP